MTKQELLERLQAVRNAPYMIRARRMLDELMMDIEASGVQSAPVRDEFVIAAEESVKKAEQADE